MARKSLPLPDVEDGGCCPTPAVLPKNGDVGMPIPLSPEHRQAEVAKIASWIAAEVNDPLLRRSVCDKIGWAIVGGEYPRLKLQTILAKLKRDYSHRSESDRGKYFVGAMRISFQECGLDFSNSKPAGIAQQPNAASDVEEGFDRFWQAFPPRRKTAKGAARNAWNDARKKANAETSLGRACPSATGIAGCGRERAGS